MNDAEHRINFEEAVAVAIDVAEEVDDSVAGEVPEKPRLLVDKSNPHQTVATLRDILADAGGLYDRGVPVRLAVDQTQKGTVAQMMTRSGDCVDGASGLSSLCFEEGGGRLMWVCRPGSRSCISNGGANGSCPR